MYNDIVCDVTSLLYYKQIKIYKSPLRAPVAQLDRASPF